MLAVTVELTVALWVTVEWTVVLSVTVTRPAGDDRVGEVVGGWVAVVVASAVGRETVGLEEVDSEPVASPAEAVRDGSVSDEVGRVTLRLPQALSPRTAISVRAIANVSRLRWPQRPTRMRLVVLTSHSGELAQQDCDVLVP